MTNVATDTQGGPGIATRICAERRRPGLALEIGEESLTWRGLADAVTRTAVGRAAAPRSASLALALPNSFAFVVHFLAGIRVGMEVQVLDPEWPRATIEAVLARLSPAQTLTDRTDLSDLAGVMQTGLETPSEDADAAPSALPDERLDTPFYTGFTSGSTGTPRGFRRNQTSWLESFESDEAAFAFSDSDVFIALGNLQHSLYLYAVLRGLAQGCRTVLMPAFRPNRALAEIRRKDGTVVWGTPTQLDSLAEAASGVTCPGVRLVLSSGAKLPPRLKARLRTVFPDARICEFYGASELSYITYAEDGAAPDASVGRPFPKVRIRIMDNDGRTLPAGETGKVFVETPFRFLGYAIDDGRTPERRGDAISTGDVGYLDDAGFLYLVGRADRMILCAAKNVYPEEVEEVLAGHPAVERAAVFGVDDERRGKRLVAAVKLRPGATAARAGLTAWCRSRLPLYKVPASYVMLDDWPLTASHKADLPRLQAIVEDAGPERRP